MEMNIPAASVTARNGTADGLGLSSITETDIIKELKEQRNLLEQEKNKLTSELNDLKKKVSKAEEERKTLTQQMKTLTEKNTAPEAEIDPHKLEIEELEKKIVELKRELKSKDDRITNLEGDQDTLYISQVAYQFEQAICTHVLPKVFERDQHATIISLLKYLSGKSRLPIADPSGTLLRKGKERWDEVCVHLNLPTTKKGFGDFIKWGHDESSTPDVIKALSLLKEKRHTIAHPRPISVKLAREKLPAVKDKMPQWHFNLIEGFIASVQKSIEKSGSKIYSKHFQLD